MLCEDQDCLCVSFAASRMTMVLPAEVFHEFRKAAFPPAGHQSREDSAGVSEGQRTQAQQLLSVQPADAAWVDDWTPTFAD